MDVASEVGAVFEELVLKIDDADIRQSIVTMLQDIGRVLARLERSGESARDVAQAVFESTISVQKRVQRVVFDFQKTSKGQQLARIRTQDGPKDVSAIFEVIRANLQQKLLMVVVEIRADRSINASNT